jgi:hypothetical protein
LIEFVAITELPSLLSLSHIIPGRGALGEDTDSCAINVEGLALLEILDSKRSGFDP